MTARFEQMQRSLDYFGISSQLSSHTKVENFSMLDRGSASPPISFFVFLLLMESLTDLASLKRCPPGSHDTHQERLRSRQTGEGGSYQDLIVDHLSDLTRNTGGHSQERQGHWWHGCEALGIFCVWWSGHGVTVRPTYMLWFKLVLRAGWSTCAGLLDDLSWRGS